MTSIN